MYVPDHFRLPDSEIERLLTAGLGANVVTVHADGPRSTFVPIHLDTVDGHPTLITHLVRNNPQVREEMVGPGLAICDITDAYVSPAWYADAATASVPTWDYITIHVHGPVTIDTSLHGALAAARDITDRMEGRGALDRVGDDALERMARAIVAVRLTVDHWQGKAKMSQNRHPDDIRTLIAHFSDAGRTDIVDFLRRVSLPHAEARFAEVEALRVRKRRTGPGPDGPSPAGYY